MSIKRIYSVVLFFSVLVWLTYYGAKAAVELGSFTATPQDEAILIEWETETELDNAGFIVARSENPHPPYLEISPFILAKGSGAVGANYDYLDEDVSEGITYYYVLEAWDDNNQFEYHGPISATIGGPPANTPTPTTTSTNTPTASVTNTPNTSWTPTRTLRPSSTRRPTNTFTPAPATYTPTPITLTPTITPTATITPSPTLYAPPEIVLALPETETPSLPAMAPTVTTQPVLTATQEPDNLFAKLLDSGTLLTIGAICLVVLFWAAIAVAAFIYLQKRNS